MSVDIYGIVTLVLAAIVTALIFLRIRSHRQLQDANDELIVAYRAFGNAMDNLSLAVDTLENRVLPLLGESAVAKSHDIERKHEWLGARYYVCDYHSGGDVLGRFFYSEFSSWEYALMRNLIKARLRSFSSSFHLIGLDSLPSGNSAGPLTMATLPHADEYDFDAWELSAESSPIGFPEVETYTWASIKRSAGQLAS